MFKTNYLKIYLFEYTMDEQSLFAEHLLQFVDFMGFDFRILSFNANITFDIVEKHIDKPWDWVGLSCNPNITFDIVEKHIDKPWSWYGLSCNPNVTFAFVEKHIDKPWDLG